MRLRIAKKIAKRAACGMTRDRRYPVSAVVRALFRVRRHAANDPKPPLAWILRADRAPRLVKIPLAEFQRRMSAAGFTAEP
jgi:hypothetical protein